MLESNWSAELTTMLALENLGKLGKLLVEPPGGSKLLFEPRLQERGKRSVHNQRVDKIFGVIKSLF